MISRKEAIAYFKRHIDLYCVEGICREAEKMGIKALEQSPIWTPVSEGLPEVNGEYLVTLRGLTGEYVKVEILYYAEDLYKIDKFDFNDKQGVSGWYNYDSEWGYYEVDNVVAWMPLPQPYTESEG